MHLAVSPVSSSNLFATFSPAPPSLIFITPSPPVFWFATDISPPFGNAPSETTTILKFFPNFCLCFIASAALFISYGISGINATSAPPAIADSNAIHPRFSSHYF